MRSRSGMMSLIGASLAIVASSALSERSLDDHEVRALTPGPAPRPRTVRQARKAPAYERTTPTTPLDFARLDEAERKRARKGAKRVRDMGQ